MHNDESLSLGASYIKPLLTVFISCVQRYTIFRKGIVKTMSLKWLLLEVDLPEPGRCVAFTVSKPNSISKDPLIRGNWRVEGLQGEGHTAEDWGASRALHCVLWVFCPFGQ